MSLSQFFGGRLFLQESFPLVRLEEYLCCICICICIWRAGGVVQSWISVRTGVLARRASVRDPVREDRKAMEEARSVRCPKEEIQGGHARAPTFTGLGPLLESLILESGIRAWAGRSLSFFILLSVSLSIFPSPDSLSFCSYLPLYLSLSFFSCLSLCPSTP